MPRPNPALLAQIANTGRGDRSIAAFLIANRQRQADSERQAALDKSLIDLREAQTRKANQPAVAGLDADVERFMQVTGTPLGDPEFSSKFFAFEEARRGAPGSAGFTLSPGQERFDAQGNPIASVPKVDVPRPSAREREIEDVMATHGLDRQDAGKLVDGLIQVTPDPTGGRLFITDLVDGTSRIAEFSNAPAPEPENIPADQTLWALAAQATGPVQSAQAGASQLSGAVGGPIDDETVGARQSFKVAENSLIRAFSLNPRYPVAEQNRIRENVAIQPGVLDSATLMRERMRAVDKFLES